MLNLRSLCVLFFSFLLYVDAFADETPTPKLRFRSPASFVEISADSELFHENAQHAVRHGKLLKLYLPRDAAMLIELGRKDAVTRQVLVCGLEEGHPFPTDPKTADLLARSMEGFFNGFTKLPRLSSSPSADEKKNRDTILKKAMSTGTPVLAESVRTASAYLHTCIIHFSLSADASAGYLSMALGMAAVPVGNTVLFVTASSIIDTEDPNAHLLWAKDTASSFADTIDSANRQEKK